MNCVAIGKKAWFFPATNEVEGAERASLILTLEHLGTDGPIGSFEPGKGYWEATAKNLEEVIDRLKEQATNGSCKVFTLIYPNQKSKRPPSQ